MVLPLLEVLVWYSAEFLRHKMMISDLCSFWDTVISTGSTPTCLNLFQVRHCHEHQQHTNMSQPVPTKSHEHWQHTNMSQPVTSETLSWALAAQHVSTCSNLFYRQLTVTSTWPIPSHIPMMLSEITNHHQYSNFKHWYYIILSLYSEQCVKSFKTPHYRDCRLQVRVYHETAVAWILMHRYLVYTPNCKIISHGNFFFVQYNEPTN
jgi:hypothetical protein